jgi:hypothetical protein
MSLFIWGLGGYKLGERYAQENNNNTRMIIHNPFSQSFSIDIKCNWDGKKYLYDKRFKLKARKGTIVVVPNSSRCQIWPVL